ncbi:Hypothetical predicted protein [Cloeon dipterum]|uniref:Progestin and adipoQ receptor family member 3 n=1 Tax=Cloeon dipterum TaxID=197152 RepID=A0A8S1C2M4_9INSE|nr:Hypothetical predicted protein [Cloeon dipterum]
MHVCAIPSKLLNREQERLFGTVHLAKSIFERNAIERKLTVFSCLFLVQEENGVSEKEAEALGEKSPSEKEASAADYSNFILTYDEAPGYLKFNPYIRSGYRGFLTTKMCIESIFWWTNETVNIWSHIFGWMLFLGLTLYDLILLNIHASALDKLIVGLLLLCFQACMILSSAYHTFSCKSEKAYSCFLTYDLCGIALSILAIYMSGVYYAFWCYSEWQQFYLLTVCLIFALAMALQYPAFQVDSHTKMLVFVGWAAYGVVPTIHWVIMMGGWQNPIVVLLLPRVLGMYAIVSLAFAIYITRIPERFVPGWVDYVGSSHQWWHVIIVGAFYYWHNTGIKYVEYRMNHGCANDLRF